MTSLEIDIQTALTEAEQEELARLAEGKTVLEVGSWYGASTVALARTASLVVAVDWHQGDAHAGHGDTRDAFLANLDRHGVRDRVVPVIGRAEDVLPMMASQAFGFAFIDAYHTQDAVLRHAHLAWELVEVGGMMAFHDYGLSQFGVTEAVDEFALSLGAPVRVVDTLAVVRS